VRWEAHRTKLGHHQGAIARDSESRFFAWIRF
jgi:hypothetical protein